MGAARIDVGEWERWIRHVPAKVVEQLCDNWQFKQRSDIAHEWGFPLVGETIDLVAVLRWLREHLKQHGPALRILSEDGEEGPLGVQFLKAKIAKTEADAAGKQLLNAQKEGRVCDRETVRGCLELIASEMIKAGGIAQKKWGQDGLDFFDDLVDRLETSIRGVLDADGPEGGNMEADGDDSSDAAE